MCAFTAAGAPTDAATAAATTAARTYSIFAKVPWHFNEYIME